MKGLDPYHRLDPGYQRSMIYRFGQVFVSACFKSGNNVFWIRFCSDHDDRHEWQRGVCSQALADLNTIHLRHHDIKQNQVRLLLFSHGQPRFAICRCEDLVVVRLEASLENIQVREVIIHD